MSGESTVDWYTLERLDPTDLDRISKLPARDQHDVLGYLGMQRRLGVDPATWEVQPSVIGGFNVLASGGMDLSVSPGMAIVRDQFVSTPGIVRTPQSSVSSGVKLVNKRSASQHTLTAAHATLRRWDLIEVRPASSPDTTDVDELRTLDIWDSAQKRFLPTGSPQIKMRHGEGDVVITTGTAGGTIPTPTAGRIPIAVVRIDGGATSPSVIFDARILLDERGESINTAIRSNNWDVYGYDGNAAQHAMNAHIEAVAGGLPVAWRNSGGAVNPCPDNDNSGALWDPVTITNIRGGGGPNHVFLYAVSRNALGLRLSKRGYTMPASYGTFDMRGWLVWSHVAPDVVTMAPSDNINLPYELGGSYASTDAVCLGTVPFGAGIGPTAALHATQMSDGRAQFVSSDGYKFPPAPMEELTFADLTGYSAATSGTTSASSSSWRVKAYATSDYVGRGFLGLDVLISVNTTVVDLSMAMGSVPEVTKRRWDLLAKAQTPGGSEAISTAITLTEPVFHPTLQRTTGATSWFARVSESFSWQMTLPASRDTRTRSGTPTTPNQVGFTLQCAVSANYAQSQGGIGATRAVHCTGYTWPHGMVS